MVNLYKFWYMFAVMLSVEYATVQFTRIPVTFTVVSYIHIWALS